MLAVLVPLTEGRSLGWPGWTIALLVAAPVAATRSPLSSAGLSGPVAVRWCRLRCSATRSMPRALLALPFFAGFRGAFMFCYALLVQEGLHASALTAGLGLVPMAATFLFASLSTARLLARFGAKVLFMRRTAAGERLVILEAHTVYLGWPHLAVADLGPGLAVAGLGPGTGQGPLFGIVLSDVPAAWLALEAAS